VFLRANRGGQSRGERCWNYWHRIFGFALGKFCSVHLNRNLSGRGGSGFGAGSTAFEVDATGSSGLGKGIEFSRSTILFGLLCVATEPSTGISPSSIDNCETEGTKTLSESPEEMVGVRIDPA
jgi:hypothetical protein